MELRARGWSISAAGREVGVSRTAANNWARGYKTYRRGEAVGFVPALDRLAVRQISSRYLSEEERINIADLRRSGLSIRKIADQLGRAPSTVSRELRRNSRRDGQYGRSKRIAGRFNAESAVTGVGSTKTPTFVS